MENQKNNISTLEEKIINPTNGMEVLIFNIFAFIASNVGFIFSVNELQSVVSLLAIIGAIVCSIYIFIIFPILLIGLKIVNPNEACVLVLFGKYYGTIVEDGFFFVNPFCTMVNPTVQRFVQTNTTTQLNMSSSNMSKKVSLKAITLNNEKQKINDCEGNPIEIGVIVIWKVVNATRAVFEVDNYKTYISTQCDASIRQVARKYPYDISADGDEKSLRGSANEVSNELKKELQSKVDMAGIEIIEAKIAHLAYAPEIAAAMLQRQQASAIIDARQKIVEGAVGMVEMALNKLSEKDIVVLDDERKAAMVSNLLVVLCGNKDAQPIVNSGSIY